MKKYRFLVVISVIALAFVSCNNQKTPNKTDILYSLYDSILGLPSGSYSLELLTTDVARWTERPTLAKDVYLVRSKDQTEPNRLIVVDGEILDVPLFKEVMEGWVSKIFEADIPLLTCRLIVDKSIKMRDVDEIMLSALDNKIRRIQYAVMPTNAEIAIRDYPLMSLQAMRMPTRFWGDSIYQQKLNLASEIPNKINIQHIGLETFEINGVSVKGEACKPMLKDLIQKDLDYIILFQMDGDMTFGDYMQIVISAREAIEELKDEYAMENFSKHLYQVFSDEEDEEIRRRFPFRYFEVSE